MKHLKYTTSLIIICITISNAVSCYATISNAEMIKLTTYLNDAKTYKDSVALENMVMNHIELQGSQPRQFDAFSYVSEYFSSKDMSKEGLSYFELVSKLLEDTGQVKGELYYYLAFYYEFFSNHEKAENALNSSLNLIGSSVYVAKIYTLLTQLKLNLNRPVLAKQYAMMAIDNAYNYNASNKIKYYAHKVCIGLFVRLEDRANLDYHLKKMKNYAEQINDDDISMKTLLVESIGYLSTGRWAKGADLLNEVKSIEKYSNVLKNGYYYYKGLTYVGEDHMKAIEYFKRSLAEPKGVRLINLALSNAWIAHANEGFCRIDQSIKYRKKAIDVYKNNEGIYDMYLGDNYSYLGHYYHDFGDFNSSLKNFLIAHKYRKDDVLNNIKANTNLIFIYSELLNDNYTTDNMNNLFSSMNETESLIQDWNYLRHYIDEDVYRESNIREFYEKSLNILFHLQTYTGHTLINERIAKYTNGLQSLIYNKFQC